MHALDISLIPSDLRRDILGRLGSHFCSLHNNIKPDGNPVTIFRNMLWCSAWCQMDPPSV
jgi:hypothetical protein